MDSIIKALSFTVLVATCSACNESHTSSHDNSDHHHTEISEPSSGADRRHEESENNAVRSETSETRFADSHTHGDASLAMVLDGSLVTVELDTPLYNLVGFEYAAETAPQKAAVWKAETILADGALLFVFNDEAGCAVVDDKISVDLDIDHHDDDHHDDDGHAEDAHEDVILRYEYRCSNAKSLKNVTVNLFKHFENLTELDLVYLGPNLQKQERLNLQKTRMNLTR